MSERILMSERGVWITEHIYCKECVDRFMKFLNDTACMPRAKGGKYWSYVRPSPWSFAGCISGLYAGEEIHYWDSMADDLQKLLCHPMRIAVLAENGEKIYHVSP